MLRYVLVYQRFRFGQYHLHVYTQNYKPGLPVVSFRFTDDFSQQHPDIQQKWVQVLLRAKGWIVPNYELAPDLQNVEILRRSPTRFMAQRHREIVARAPQSVREL